MCGGVNSGIKAATAAPGCTRRSVRKAASVVAAALSG
jgi:hypothetical protein